MLRRAQLPNLRMRATHDEAERVADAELLQQLLEAEERVRSVTETSEFGEKSVVVEPHEVLELKTT